MTENPYQSPAADGASASDAPAREQPVAYKLYTAGQVTVATFIGAPLAGCLVLAINYFRMGNRKAAFNSMFLGVVATALLIGLAFVLPKRIPALVLSLGSAAGMFQVAESLQGSAVSRHLHIAKGQKASSWAAAGIGLVCLVVLFLVIFVVGFVVLFVMSPEEFMRE